MLLGDLGGRPWLSRSRVPLQAVERCSVLVLRVERNSLESLDLSITKPLLNGSVESMLEKSSLSVSIVWTNPRVLDLNAIDAGSVEIEDSHSTSLVRRSPKWKKLMRRAYRLRVDSVLRIETYPSVVHWFLSLIALELWNWKASWFLSPSTLSSSSLQ
jgi:hypothetical protein